MPETTFYSPSPILLVEDDLVTAHIEIQALQKSGLQIKHAINGEQAIELCESMPNIGLVLMDIELGSLKDGADYAREIQNQFHIPILYLSQHASPEIIQKVHGTEHYGYITKDSGAAVLVESVLAALHRIRLEKELSANASYLQEVLNAIQDGLCVLNHNLEIEQTNQTINLQHQSQMPLEGKKCYKVFHDKNEPCQSCPSQRAFVSGKVERELVSHVTAESVKYIELFAYPIVNKQTGKIDKVVEYVRDETKRKMAGDRLKTSRKNFKEFFETMDDLIFITDLQGKIIYTNPAAEIKLGYLHNEMRQMSVIDLHPLEKQPEAMRIFQDILNNLRDNCPLPLQKKDGTLLPVENRIWRGQWNNQDSIFGISKDLSKEHALLQRFQKIFDHNPTMMAISSFQDRKFLDVNQTFINTLGYSKEEILGKSSHELGIFVKPPEQEKIVQEFMKNGSLDNKELQIQTKNKHVLHCLFSGDIIDNQGEKCFLTVAQDITDRKEAENKLIRQQNELIKKNKKLQEAVVRDSLTGLYNHGHIHELLQHEIDKASRYNRPLSILMIDIDFFKKINDNYGHKIGDSVLIGISNTMLLVFRETDIVGRYGGEEFLVILPETQFAQGIIGAERLRKQIEFTIFPELDHSVTISIGISEYNGQSINTLINQADQALYRAKNNGRNCIMN